MAVGTPIQQAQLGMPFGVSLAAPVGPRTMGVRIEVPVTRAIATPWMAATRVVDLWMATIEAPVVAGAYELVWMDNDGLGPGGNPLFEAFEPLIVVDLVEDGAVTEIDYPFIDHDDVRPDVDAVAKLERTRCIDKGGNDVETFTADTSPTNDEVDALIDASISDIISYFPVETINPRHYGQISRAVELHTAILIEGSFYREQANDRQVALYQQIEQSLVTAVTARINKDLEQQNLIGGFERSADILGPHLY